MRYRINKLFLIFGLHLLIIYSCSSSEYRNLSKDETNNIPLAIFSGIFPLPNQRIEVIKDEYVTVHPCCILGELGYDISWEKILIDENEMKIIIKGNISSSYDTWDSINIFIGKTITSFNNGSIIVRVIGVTFTDEKGNFFIESRIEKGYKLYISYIGNQTYEYHIYKLFFK